MRRENGSPVFGLLFLAGAVCRHPVWQFWVTVHTVADYSAD